jgi:hypothetical protein
MSRVHLRYLLMSFAATAGAGVLTAWLVFSLFASEPELLAGAASIIAWWVTLAASGVAAILAGRKVAAVYTDPRAGRLAGAAVGLWAGLGAAAGQAVAAAVVAAAFQAEARAGLIVFFGLVNFVVSLAAASLAGRETAHPPEEEEA